MKLKIFVFLAVIIFFVPQTFAAKPIDSGKPNPPGSIPNSICIDPGHGGTEIGTSNGDLLEKDVNLSVASYLKAKLSEAGYTVFMTREEDINLTNADRYNYCNNQKAAILISIHHNGSSDTNTDYTTALYMKKSDQKLSTIVAEKISSQLGIENKGISRFASGILLKSEVPSTISEGFFLTNSNEFNLIRASDRLKQEADALFSAVQTYFNN